MMLDKLRTWVKNRSSSNAPITPQQAQHAAQGKREARTNHVADLHAQVRSLQQQITDLAAGMESGTEGGGSHADRDRLVVLEQELEEKQRELARFQGRI